MLSFEEKSRIYNEMVNLISDPKISLYEDLDSFQLYAKFFHKIGRFNYLSVDGDKIILSKRKSENMVLKRTPFSDTPCFSIDTTDKNGISVKSAIEASSTLKNIVDKLSGIYIPIKSEMYYIIADHVVIYATTEHTKKNDIDYMNVVCEEDNIQNLAEIINSCIVPSNLKNEKNTYRIAYRGQYSIETSICEFDNWDTDIAKNYNDDVPFKEMNNILRNDKAALMLLYGKPGTGKTSIIKSLINENPTQNFIFIDTSICDSISDGRFLDFMEENKGAVIVFEDCERLLANRKDGDNYALSTILNLTDGLIAESMKLKFICTFNCDISRIDDAILRKGRLTLKYEFKELTLEKTKNIYPDAEKPMTLGDAYNAEIKNDFSEPKKNKIGFVV